MGGISILPNNLTIIDSPTIFFDPHNKFIYKAILTESFSTCVMTLSVTMGASCFLQHCRAFAQTGERKRQPNQPHFVKTNIHDSKSVLSREVSSSKERGERDFDENEKTQRLFFVKFASNACVRSTVGHASCPKNYYVGARAEPAG
jgi:hypothetical protein